MKMKRYKIKKISADKLHESEGRVHTEDMFLKDSELAMMFMKYMISNIKYLKRYEVDRTAYDNIQKNLISIQEGMKSLVESFKEHQKE